MKTLNKRLLAGALFLTVPVGAIMATVTVAADEDRPIAQAQQPLIDGEFENAVRVIVTKRFCNRIDATDEQRTKLSAIFKETMQSTRPLREQFRKKLLDVSEAMASSTATDDQIKAKVLEARALRQQLMDQRVNAALEVRKILTAEQRQKIHSRITELIAGNIRPRRLGFLMQ